MLFSYTHPPTSPPTHAHTHAHRYMNICAATQYPAPIGIATHKQQYIRRCFFGQFSLSSPKLLFAVAAAAWCNLCSHMIFFSEKALSPKNESAITISRCLFDYSCPWALAMAFSCPLHCQKAAGLRPQQVLAL